MRIFKKTIIFICLNLLVAGALQFGLTAPSKFTLRFADLRREDYNAVILGHSLGYRGLDPHMLEDGGDRVFNLCQGGEPFKNLFHLLRQANELHPLDTVYLDLYFDYWTKSYYDAEKYTQNMEVYRELSVPNRLSFLTDVFFDRNYNSFLWGYRLSEDAVTHLPETLRTKLSPAYRQKDPALIDSLGTQGLYRYTGQGFEYTYDRVDDHYRCRRFDPAKITPEALADFDRIVSYCRQENIELICFISALPPARLRGENHDTVHDFFARVCADRQVAFYDMNYVRFSLLPRGPEDYLDEDGHMLGATAQAQSRLLRQIHLAPDRERFFEPDYDAVLAGLPDAREE